MTRLEAIRDAQALLNEPATEQPKPLRLLAAAAFAAKRGPVLGVGVMTDTDNTGTQAVGNYAGIQLSCGNN